MNPDEFQKSLYRLKAELGHFGDSNPEAQSKLLSLITDLESHLEAPSKEASPLSLDHLRQVAEDFEVEHPQITQLVNRILVTLSNMGI